MRQHSELPSGAVRVPDWLHALRHELRQHRIRSRQLRKLRPGVCRWPSVFERSMHGQLCRGFDQVRPELRGRANESHELRHVRYCLPIRASVQRGYVRLRHRPHTLQWRVRRHQDQRHQLRDLRHCVQRRALLQRGRVRLRERPDFLLERLREHTDQCRKLRRLWHGLPNRSRVRGWRLRLSDRANLVLERVREHADRSQQLRHVRHPLHDELRSWNLRCTGELQRRQHRLQRPHHVL
jgi:hypothetical protein